MSSGNHHNQTNSKLMASIITIIIVVTLTIGQFTDCGLPGWSDGMPADQGSVASAGEMVIHGIDVGQGDCVLVQGGGVNILIDSGETGCGKIVRKYLKSIGVTHLDWVIGTHAHSDHIGGLDNVIKNVPVDNVMLTAYADNMIPTSKSYTALLEQILDKNLTVTAAQPSDIYTFGDSDVSDGSPGTMTMTVLSPLNPSQYTSENDCSIALMFECGGIRFFTAGDIEDPVEKDLLMSGVDLNADIYKASHHGSNTSSSEAFLKALSPKHVFISSKKGNSYKHPHQTVLDRLKSIGAEIHRNDIEGTIVYHCKDGEVTVSTEK